MQAAQSVKSLDKAMLWNIIMQAKRPELRQSYTQQQMCTPHVLHVSAML